MPMIRAKMSVGKMSNFLMDSPESSSKSPSGIVMGISLVVKPPACW